jgi:ketosteroid isomerase-like protein
VPTPAIDHVTTSTRTRLAAYTHEMAIDAIRAAYDALGTGDVEPLVSLMDEGMEWRGRRRGWRFWRPPPS